MCRPDAAGLRRIVLATPIAESSITIDGVRIVVDSGYRRAPHYDLTTGVSRLRTEFISEASADQRRGRAGRTAPGGVGRVGGSHVGWAGRACCW